MREENNMVREIVTDCLTQDEYTEMIAELRPALNAGLRIGCCMSDKEKKSKGRRVFGECQKVPEEWQGFCPYDFLITFYEPNIAGMTDEQMHILAVHELLHIGVDVDELGIVTGTRVVPHDMEDFGAVVRRYGVDWSR